ncbi:MAG TPA: nucleotidyltransferase [Candidatus Acidoferrum sp.]|nr:nucleotidyltransferase [Candidatus Acidoferrum sp.]
MSALWEAKFRTWSKPASDTEAEKQANAERMIRAAVREYPPLGPHDIKIIPQGSYRNNTNVRQESDVDICVCCTDTFFYDLGLADYTKAEANIVDAAYSFAQFKTDVQNALETKFGKRGVSRGDKAFDVHENTYRVDADVVAAFEYRLYKKRTLNAFLGAYVSEYVTPPGTKFYSDGGREVVNWPEQQYANGVAKNDRTGNRFKSVVRALKSLKYEMEEKGVAEAKAIGSFLVECLVFNVPDNMFQGDSYFKNVRDCLAVCFAATSANGDSRGWLEVNGIKYLFHPSQPWTREQANEFTLAAWRYCGFS